LILWPEDRTSIANLSLSCSILKQDPTSKSTYKPFAYKLSKELAAGIRAAETWMSTWCLPFSPTWFPLKETTFTRIYWQLMLTA